MLTMYDAVTPANLPAGGDAYAGYVDGLYANLTEIRARHPGARIVEIAVFPQNDGECLDVETGDATPEQAPDWTARQLRRGVWRPIIYTSRGQVQRCADLLAAAGINRQAVRWWSAHYTGAPHLCGPGCDPSPLGFEVDGTQWQSTAGYDVSTLRDDFFTPQSAPVTVTTTGKDDDMIVVFQNPDGSSSLMAVPGMRGPLPLTMDDQKHLPAGTLYLPASGPLWKAAVAQQWADTVLENEAAIDAAKPGP